MKTILVVLAIIGAIAALSIPQRDLKRKEFPSGIVNGTNVTVNEYNFLGSVHWKIDEYLTFLTGSAVILSDRWLLTSAVSVYNQTAGNLTVRVGSTFAEKDGQLVNVSKVIIHPKFNESTWQNDLALLKVKERLIFSETVASAPFSGFSPDVNSTGVVVGFGVTLKYFTDEDAKLLRLRSVNATVVDLGRNNTTGRTNVIRTRGKSGAGPSVFDWGSPLIVDGAVVGTFIGDLSLSRNSTTIDSFVNLNTNDYWQWIIENIIDI